ncbi:fungal-specific transcription factor domain-containing protein [Hygrophoropsis aurantiaca]|uniref:Fungal-specific transcription factor domain-containing protein n=1 Tax=Hygrophoropsis aurantiaca TaxID=72124 RepID=A0ACB8AKA9_9AGAM|nr:fungal-specific transcription factor domain-containing protein [Hygrophoropsis aurantiaca]
MADQPIESPPSIPDNMADGLSYSPSSAYLPPTGYYPQNHNGAHVHNVHHVVTPPSRPETQQRKRPKYTRSKTGCLTCRVKKIKCDETKPNCMRCTHGQRDCTWPEGVPVRKKATPRKDSLDGRPSTADSSGMSETSTPPTRDCTPPKRVPAEFSLPPALSRRPSEPFVPPAPDQEAARRQQMSSHGYPMHHSNQNANVLTMIPEMPTYPQQQRYDTHYASSLTSLHPVPPRLPGPSHSTQHPISIRSMGHHLQSQQWSQPQPQLMPSLDSMGQYFPNTHERNLIHHYCDKSMSIIMAIPSENPIVAANLPLVLDRTPGSDIPAEALRMALLGVAAIHQSFLLSQNEVTRTGGDDMLQMAHSYRLNSKRLLARACTTAEGAQSDASLAASLAISLMDIFSGGRNWAKNLDLAKTLVNVRGGPSTVLARTSDTNLSPSDQSARTRLLLEILAVYDIAACISSGDEPTVLNSTSDRWWFHDSPDTTSYVEQVFGMSRAFVPLLAYITTFISRVLRGSARISEVTGTSSTNEDTETEITAECHDLYHQLEGWADPREHIPRRVHTGNRIYQKATQILLLRDILRVSPTDPLVQSCTDTILELCAECTASNMGVDLIWPVIIAASHSYGLNRARVAEIFKAFSNVRDTSVVFDHTLAIPDHFTGCFEVDTSENIVLQVWKRLDQGAPGADWRSVMKDSQLTVLVL